MPAQSFDEAFEQVKQLVADFQKGKNKFLSPEYSEAAARIDFIDKLKPVQIKVL
jgi:hypothetical protein